MRPRFLHLFSTRIILLALILFLQMPPSAEASGKNFSPKEGEHWILIDKNKLRLYLYKGTGNVVKSYPIAIGKGVGVKKSRTDLITPAGDFKIWRVIEDARELVYDPAWFNEPGEPQKGAYGAKLISFYNPWQIAIHGTNAPGSIGKRVTHGCVRLRNRDITELTTYVKPGMRLRIVETRIEKDDI